MSTNILMKKENQHKKKNTKDKAAFQERPQAGKQNVVSLQSVQKSSKVVLSEPRVYAEAQEIADHIKIGVQSSSICSAFSTIKQSESSTS